MRRFLWIAAVLSVALPRVSSQAPRTEPWTIDDLVEIEEAGSFDIAPGGGSAVYVKSVPDAKTHRMRGKIFLVDLATGKSRPLTGGKDPERAPRFSPDGRRIAFLAARPDPAKKKSSGRSDREEDGDDGPKTQVHVLRLDGGEAVSVTDFPEGVTDFRFAAPERLVVAARERLSREEWERKEAEDETLVVEDRTGFAHAAVRLHVVDLEAAEGGTRRVSSGTDQIAALAVSPDGRLAVAAHQVSPTFEVDNREPPRIRIWDLASGTSREIFADRKSRPGFLAFSDDGRRIYAVGNRPTVDGEEMAGLTVAVEVDPATLATRDVPLDWPRALTETAVHPVTGGFLARLADGAAPRLALYAPGPDGAWTRRPVTGARAARIEGIVARPGTRRVVYRTSTASDPGGWYAADLEGAALVREVRLEVADDAFDGKVLARAEILRFPGAGDEEVEAILYHPHVRVEGGKHPLVLMTHGGPHAADYDHFMDRWAYAPNLYAQRGAYVLCVNYHGSSDYGLPFSESIRGRYFELELEDLCRGLAHVIAREPVDPSRLGLYGWSNGAILSINMLTLLPRFAPGHAFSFRACVAGAGDVNWTSDYGNCAFGVAFDDYYLGGPPWRRVETYVEKSPLFHAEKVTTPTLILFGTEDRAVPTSQGWEWYRALQQIGRAEVRFVLFPGEEHGLRDLRHRRRKLDEEMRFMDRHLFGGGPAPATPLVEGSPLWTALRSRSFARSGAALGRAVGTADGATVLVPETIPFGGVAIGRFEVTRAQWKAFDPATTVDPGTENLPMTGISFAEAEGYVAWLSRMTGLRFRLPTADEAGRLQESAGPEENTLEWWAGFEPGPDDATSLVELARAGLVGAEGATGLLLPAGSRPAGLLGPKGSREPVFDAGGNAAEWVVDEPEGGPESRPESRSASRPETREKGRAAGGHVFSSGDHAAGELRPPREVTGLRVVLDPRPAGGGR